MWVTSLLFIYLFYASLYLFIYLAFDVTSHITTQHSYGSFRIFPYPHPGLLAVRRLGAESLSARQSSLIEQPD